MGHALADEDAYLRWTAAWIEAAMKTLQPGGLLYCFGQLGKRQHVMLHLMSQAASAWQFHDLIIWDRVVGYNDRRDSFTPAYEMIFVLRKSGEVMFNKDAVREPYDAATIAHYARDKRYKNPGGASGTPAKRQIRHQHLAHSLAQRQFARKSRPSLAETAGFNGTHHPLQQRRGRFSH
jgi:DNA modification methylase